MDNFILSCAGYCVATYVLGIGDRHNDNIMITRGPSFAYSLPVHSFYTRRDRVASLTTCRLYGAAIQRDSPLGPGRALTLPCGWNIADGKLFHIDFGHFLGNFKSKFGIKREKAPFVFTSQFAHVMGGQDSAQFDRFCDVCGQAYNVVRRNGHTLLALFTLMLSTGIPELRVLEDIDYLKEMLSLDMTDEQASQKMRQLVLECMNCKTTKVNNIVHILAHG